MDHFTINPKFIGIITTSLAILLTSGGIFHTSILEQLDNSTFLDSSICLQLPANTSTITNTTTESTMVSTLVFVVSLLLPASPLMPHLKRDGHFGSNIWETFTKPLLSDVVMSHLIGQASAFSSTEALQFLIVHPDQFFYKHCPLLTMEDCNNKFVAQQPVANLPIQLLVNQICSNVNVNVDEQLAPHTNSLPQLALVMLGAAVVMFAYCYRQSLKITEKKRQQQQNVFKYFPSTYFRFIVLFFLIGIVLLSFYLVKNVAQDFTDSWTDLLYSFGGGCIIQCLTLYILKHKNLLPNYTILSSTTTNSPSHETDFVNVSIPLKPIVKETVN